mmetsp:Transcript_1694/g.3960  ORF Transcript_1694/g.3960 Transcript_1694/m.3960 type:complete len:91 (-) Transcript_1694:1134-1406(-)
MNKVIGRTAEMIVEHHRSFEIGILSTPSTRHANQRGGAGGGHVVTPTSRPMPKKPTYDDVVIEMKAKEMTLEARLSAMFRGKMIRMMRAH